MKSRLVGTGTVNLETGKVTYTPHREPAELKGLQPPERLVEFKTQQPELEPTAIITAIRARKMKERIERDAAHNTSLWQKFINWLFK